MDQLRTLRIVRQADGPLSVPGLSHQATPSATALHAAQAGDSRPKRRATVRAVERAGSGIRRA